MGSFRKKDLRRNFTEKIPDLSQELSRASDGREGWGERDRLARCEQLHGAPNGWAH